MGSGPLQRRYEHKQDGQHYSTVQAAEHIECPPYKLPGGELLRLGKFGKVTPFHSAIFTPA
jgi:hypothetical protein